jgi:2-polyprenyl-6-methoxyphenol hydroxylase-like FAD-dependent oxidoreductase
MAKMDIPNKNIVIEEKVETRGKKILISGAGIAGLTTAYWLDKYGYEVTIVEKDAEVRSGGYKVDVRGAALQVAKKMGIYSDLVKNNVNIQKSQVVTSDLKVLEFDDDVLGHSSEGDIEVNRWDLCKIISKVTSGVKIVYGDSITQIDSESGVVSFEKMAEKRFDLVIGADGTYSNVRRLVFGDHSQFLRETGLHFCVFPTDNFLKLSDTEIVYLEKGKFMAAYAVKESSYACLTFHGVERRLIADDRKQIFKKKFADIGWRASDFVYGMQASDQCYFGSINQIRMKKWHKGRVALVGDAAHAAHGIATSMAMVGSYVLAKEIMKAGGDAEVAFQNYEERLREFVENGQNLSESNYKMLRDGDSWWVKFQLFLMQKMPKSFLGYLTKKGKARMKKAANAIDLD